MSNSAQMEDRVRQLFGLSIEAKMAAADVLTDVIGRAAMRLVNCLLNDGKILLCGNGGSAAGCLYFSSSMLNHFEVERPSLPVMTLTSDAASLTALASESKYEQIFAKQINAFGHADDVLIILTTTGNASSTLNALKAAHSRGMDTIVLTGGDGGMLANHLGPEDIEVRVSSGNAARIREIHVFILHCFCDLIDNNLFGQMLE